MGIYLAAFALSMAFAVWYTQKKPAGLLPGQAKKAAGGTWILALCSALPLWLLAGLRYNVGTDYSYTYTPCYEAAASGAASFDIEPGFWWLTKAVVALGGGRVWLFLVAGGILIGGFWYAFGRQSACFGLSVALFFCGEAYFTSLNGMRQYMALAICCCAFAFVDEKGWKGFAKYAALILLAALLHESSVLFLPLYFLKYLCLGPKKTAIALAVLTVCNWPISMGLSWLVQFTPYADYLGSVLHTSSRIYWWRLGLYLLFWAVGSRYYYADEHDKSPKYRFLYWLVTAALYLSANRNIIPQASRLMWSLEIGAFLLVPAALSAEKNKKVRAAWIIAILAYCCVFTGWQIFVCGYHEVVPYQCVFWPGVALF